MGLELFINGKWKIENGELCLNISEIFTFKKISPIIAMTSFLLPTGEGVRSEFVNGMNEVNSG